MASARSQRHKESIFDSICRYRAAFIAGSMRASSRNIVRLSLACSCSTASTASAMRFSLPSVSLRKAQATLAPGQANGVDACTWAL